MFMFACVISFMLPGTRGIKCWVWANTAWSSFLPPCIRFADTDGNLGVHRRTSVDRSEMQMEPLTGEAIATRLRVLAHMYDEAQKCVLATMATDSFRRFKRATRSG